MSREIRCNICEKVVMVLENGSIIKKGTIAICSECDNPSPLKGDQYDASVDELMNLLGMKR